MRDDRERLLDINEAISKIEKYIVWSVVEESLPVLKSQVITILEKAENR